MNVELSTGVNLNVHEHGAGSPTYVLIHGWAVSGLVWEPIVEAWPDGAGRVIVPDLRGTGFSSKPKDGYTIDAYAGDIVALIAKLDLSDVVLVGHSMGGAIAQRVALDCQDKLRALVLVSPVPASGVPLPDDQIGFFRSLGGHHAGAEQVLSMVMVKRPSPDRFARMVHDVATVSIEAFLGGFDAWRTASFADRLGELKLPTLVIAGADEQPLTPDFIEAAVVKPIAGATLELLPGTGHYPQAESTELLRDKLVAAAKLGAS